MPHSINREILCCGLLVLTAAAGCQRGPAWNLVPVEGTITKNGRPLAGIEVVFLADLDAGTQGPKAWGIADATGHYRLHTANGDGVVVGKHRVVLFDRKADAKQTLRDSRGKQLENEEQVLPQATKRLQDKQKPATDATRVPPCYERFNETPLRAEVRSGTGQTFDFDIP